MNIKFRVQLEFIKQKDRLPGAGDGSGKVVLGIMVVGVNAGGLEAVDGSSGTGSEIPGHPNTAVAGPACAVFLVFEAKSGDFR